MCSARYTGTISAAVGACCAAAACTRGGTAVGTLCCAAVGTLCCTAARCVVCGRSCT